MTIGIEGVGTIHVGYFQKQDWESEEIKEWLQQVANYALDLWNLFRYLEPDLTRALRDKGAIGPNDLFTDLAISKPDQASKAMANPEKAEKIVSEYREKQQAKKQSVETEEREESEDEFRARLDEQYASLDEGFPSPMSKVAFHGIAGELIDIISPQAETCKEALLAQFLVAMGNLIGHGAYFPQAGWHCLNEYIATVGATSRGRKGNGWTAIKNLLESIDYDWASGRVIGGIPSGEGIIENVRDAREVIKQSYKSKLAGKEPEVTIDEGVEDKRLLLMEEELRRFLSAGGRTTNTLFDVARLAWDNPNVLYNAAKHSPVRATGAHISLIGHITKDELKKCMTSTEYSNGFGNRIAWIASKRTQRLPRPKWIEWSNHEDVIKRLSAPLLTFSKETAPKGQRMAFNSKAESVWDEFYHSIDDNQNGIVGNMLGRTEAHVLRFSMIYAALENKRGIEPDHLRAAIAFWDYCARSVKYIFGETTGSTNADKILWELKRRRGGMLKKDMYKEVFNGRISATELSQSLSELAHAGTAKYEPEKASNGKLIERWFAKEYAASDS